MKLQTQSAIEETKAVTSTELEFIILTKLINMLYAEAGFSDVSTSEIAEKLNLNVNTVKGVIGSLTKKGIVYVGEDDFEDIIYLENEFWYLHPEWCSEENQ